MRPLPQTAAILASLLTLSGCATSPSLETSTAASTGDVITIAVGPCFGFCPVYETVIHPDGAIIYTGEQHTEVLGERRRAVGTDVYTSLAAELAIYRPADGSTIRIECATAITDTSIYTITWQKPDGGKAVATHQSRCSGGPGKTLDALLQTLPERLGIDDWARQVTRPGTPRG